MADLLTSAVNVAGTAALTVFIALYAALAPWWRTPAGRALMAMSSGFLLVLVTLLLRHPFGLPASGSAFFTWFQAGAGAVAFTGICAITRVLVRAQRHGGSYFGDVPLRQPKGRR